MTFNILLHSPLNAQYSRLLLKAAELGINFLNWGWVNQTQSMISLYGNSSIQAEVPFYYGNGFLLQGKNDNWSPLMALRGGKWFFISRVNVFYTSLNDSQSFSIMLYYLTKCVCVCSWVCGRDSKTESPWFIQAQPVPHIIINQMSLSKLH